MAGGPFKQQRPIKGLNKGSGEKRFVFKSFSQRIEEVDVDVFRSLAPVKLEPTAGTSFFHESLVSWRELNSAADFTSVYEELLPIVQTLPQLLLHKEFIMSKLLSRLQLTALLSLEPILSLIAILSRDLREEFILFLPRFLGNCVDLFQAGGDREPEVIEQVFTSLSYIFKYMQKHLLKDIGFILKATKRLRYYHRSYIQEFAAESVSFLLRNTSLEQLVKGVRRIVMEVACKPSKENVTSCSFLLWHTLKGSGSTLHSRAEPVLRLLLDSSTLTRARKKDPGGEVMVNIIAETFTRLCEELNRTNLSLLWVCLLEEVDSRLIKYTKMEAALDCKDAGGDVLDHETVEVKVNGGNGTSKVTQDRKMGSLEGDEVLDHKLSQESELYISSRTSKNVWQEEGMHLELACVLSLLNVVIEFRNGGQVFDFKPLFHLSDRLLQSTLFSHEPVSDHVVGSLAPARLYQAETSQLQFQIVRFILAIVKSHSQVAGASLGPSVIVSHVSSWTSVWNCPDYSSLLFFIQGLLKQDAVIIQAFAPYLLRTFDQYIDMHPVDVLPLMVDFFDKLGMKSHSSLFPVIEQPQKLPRLAHFVFSVIEEATKKMEQGISKDTDNMDITSDRGSPEPAVLWASLKCYPYLVFLQKNDESLAWNYVLALDRSLSKTQVSGDIPEVGIPKEPWEYILAVALFSAQKVMSHFPVVKLSSRLHDFLNLAVRHRHSPDVLNSVAEFLDVSVRDLNDLSICGKVFSELDDNDALSWFENNLGSCSKVLRLSTLRILIHYESVSVPLLADNQVALKRRKGIDGRPCKDDNETTHSIFKDLLSLETATFCLELGRQSNILLTRLKVSACTGCMPERYLVPLTHAVIGMLHNRFGLLWDASIDCLAGLLEMHRKTIWETFIHYLRSFQELFLSRKENSQNLKSVIDEDLPEGLPSRFEHSWHYINDSTDAGTLVTLLLRALQRVPKIVEARSRQIMPLFLTFSGGGDMDLNAESWMKVKTLYGGKEWKVVLKQWLNLLCTMKNARAYFKGPVVKDMLSNRFLMDSDPDIQLKALECLLNWKDNYLIPYEEKLKNLISFKMAREEMTAWNIGKESDQVQATHREGLIPVIMRLLFPKILRTKLRIHKKMAGSLQRKAVLSFLAHLDVHELASFFILLLKPLESAFTRDGMEIIEGRCAWELAMEERVGPDYIAWVEDKSVTCLSHKKKTGFLHMVKDILETFDGRCIRAYLNALLAFVFRILQNCQLSSVVEHDEMDNGNKLKDMDSCQEIIFAVSSGGHEKSVHEQSGMTLVDEDSNMEIKSVSFDIQESKSLQEINNEASSVAEATELRASGTKDLRTLAFKVLTIVFSKFDDLEFCPVYWDIFFGVIKPIIVKLGKEGANGDSPSALLFCLLAMSRSPILASLLQREEDLVPSLGSLLLHKNASSPVVGVALSFLENLFELENQDSLEDKHLVLNILLPHLSTLLSNIQGFLSSQQDVSRGKKLSPSVKRGLHILIQLSKHIKGSVEAVQLLDVLLPFLTIRGKAEQEEPVEVLCIIRELSPFLNTDSREKICSFVGPLLASTPHQDVRSAACQVLLGLSEVDTSIGSVAGLLADLNALSTSTVGEYDYERRLQAYGRLSATFFCQLSHNQTLLIISQAIYDMGSDDISIRQSSSGCLSTFVHFLASVFKASEKGLAIQDIDDHNENVKTSMTVVDSVADESSLSIVWSVESVYSVVQKVLLPNIRKSMDMNSLTIRREWVALLRDMVLNLDMISPLSEFLPLVSTDAEVDFFNNINHIQIHRRIKAMSRFKELSKVSKFSQGVLVRILAPLFMSSLFEGKGDKDGNLVQSAVEALSCIAARLHWDPYYGLVMRVFRNILLHPEYEKLLVRLLCCLLDNFHFRELSTPDQGSQEMDDVRESTCSSQDDISTDPKKEGSCSKNESSAAQMDIDSDVPKEIQMQLKRRVLPEFTKLMVSKANIVNVPVALAVVKILQLMPKEVLELELPRIIQNIVNLLKSRSLAVRDEARAGLSAIVGILGPSYLGFVVEKLQATLKRGYEVHVLGFTLNSLITKLFPTFKVGEVDYCIENIMDLLGNDIFEDVAEEKEVEKIAFKMKETKRTRTYESMSLLAQKATFQIHGATLLKPVRGRLKHALVPKTKNKLERVLRQLAVGIQSNPSLKQDDLLIYVHGLVEDGMQEEKLAVEVAAGKKRSNVDLSFDKKSNDVAKYALPTEFENHKVIKPNQHLIIEYALHLLESYLKRAKLKKWDQHVLSMLDPMVILLHSCLESKQGGVLGLALKCLRHLLRLPLPSISLISNDLITLVLSMAQRFGKDENNVVKACFNALVALLKHAKSACVTKDQLCLILQLPVFVDLGMTESNVGLLLLKAIVGRKLVVPELYDMINRVAQLMVTSHSTLIRRYCSQIMLQFLLDYPLGSKRLQQHLDYFVSNLSYEHVSGREAALEMLHAIIVKFPMQAIDEQSETLFLPLVTRLVNDDANQVRAMVGTVLKVLMGRVSQRSLQRMLDFCFSWMKGDKHQLWRAAAQVLGFLVEVTRDKFASHIKETLVSSVALLKIVSESNTENEDTNMGIGSALWQEGYYTLTMLEKLFKQFPDTCLQKASEDLWDLVDAFLLHQHVWLRKASCRLLDVYFVACTAHRDAAVESGKAFLLQPSRLMLLAAILCQGLNSPLLDEVLAEQIQKNLLFVAQTLYFTFPITKEKTSWMEVIGQEYQLDSSAQERVIKALSLLQVHSWIFREGKDSSMFVEEQTQRSAGPDKAIHEDMVLQARYHLLLPVFKRLETILLRVNEVPTKAILKWYDMIISHLGGEGVQPYLWTMMVPLYRFTEASAAKTISDDIKNLAASVLSHLREVVGTGNSVQVYNEIRQMIKNTREERTRAKKLRVLVDPEGHAKRKLKLTAKRQAQKKKKKIEFRDHRHN